MVPVGSDLPVFKANDFTAEVSVRYLAFPLS